jgi:hypothetical protein
MTLKPTFRKYTFEKLILNQAINAIVVLLRPHSSKLKIGRLQWRRINDKTYKEIKCQINSSHSFESLITSSKSPEIYFNIQKHRLIDNVTIGGDWVETKSYNLKTEKTRMVLDEKTLNKILGAKRTWITNLINLTHDDKGLHCVIGIENKEGIGYYLCEIIFKPINVKRLTLLKNIFY